MSGQSQELAPPSTQPAPEVEERPQEATEATPQTTLGNAALAATLPPPPPAGGGLLDAAERGAPTDTAPVELAQARSETGPEPTDGAPTHDVPAIGSNPDVTHDTVATQLEGKPEALAALQSLRDDPAFAGLPAAQQGALYQQFLEHPNGATAQYLRGLATYHGSADKEAGYAAYQAALRPQGGSYTLNGTTYTLRDGQLMNADGTVAGDIRTDGTYQLTGQTERSSIYDGLQHVTMTNGTGDQKQTLLEQSDVPALGSNPDVTEATVRATLTDNPRAVRALNALRDDPAFAGLTAAQQGALYQQFQQTPNEATAQYLRGIAAYHGSEDKTAGYAAFRNALQPDGGTFTSNGTTYTIRNGELVNQAGEVAGNIRTDGTFQLAGQTERSSVYDDIHARVQMTEGTGDQRRTLLDLFDADPRGKLDSANVNGTFAGMARSTMRALRRENVSMVATDGYRTFQQQNDDYAQGRTRPGAIVTNARGGESWHNYGLGADFAMADARGRASWPEDGDYAQLWRRYGRVAQNNGLTWGGGWNHPDRPHVEYHPGYGDGDARRLLQTHQTSGLRGVWQQMGL